MDKQKQIEEMASDIGYAFTEKDLSSDDAKRIAVTLYLLGYRKISENAVVLTREEYDKLKYENEVYLMEGRKVCQMEVETRHELEKLKKDFDYNLVQERRTIRKETAEKFAEMAKARATAREVCSYQGKKYVVYHIVDESFDVICKEITEGKENDK